MWRSVIVLLALGPSLMAAGPARVVSIDRGWLRQRGPGPYLLDRPGTRYVLAADVRTEGTAFVVDAAGVVLDLNGHTIVYGDSPPIVVRNGGFEEGSGRRVPGWDLGRAPAAELAPNTSYLFGKQVLRLKGFRTAQRIVSEPVAVPATDHTHVACVTPARGDYRTVLTLRVVDARTGKVLGTGRSPNVERGFSAVAPFRPGTSRSIRLVVEATPPAGCADSLDLDQAVVSASHDYGVVATNAWTGDVPGWTNVAPAIKGLGRRVKDFTLRNGSVLQGRARGHGSSPLFFANARGLTVERVQALTTGMDTFTLNAEWAAGSVTIRDCTFRHDVDNVSDRGKQYATLRLVRVNGPVRVEGNRFLDVPLVGVLVDGAVYGPPVVIRDNEIRQKAVALNGYGILVVASRNFEIADNRIVADNGRGILIDGYRKEPVDGGEVRGNYVEVRERANREYWARIEARALRLRSNGEAGSPHRNLRIHHNTFVAVTGPGLAQKAFGVRVSYHNVRGRMSDADVRIEHNTIRAITTSPDPGSRAAALVLDDLAAGVDLRVRDNVLESNDVSLLLSESEGPVEGARLTGNTFLRSREGARRPYAAVHAGYWTAAVRGVEVLGPRLGADTPFRITWAGSGPKDLGVGALLTVTATRGSHRLPGARVSVHDNRGRLVFSGKTDERGGVRDVPVVRVRYRQETSDPRKITADERGPFRVRVTDGEATAAREVDLKEDRAEVRILLPGR